MEKVILKWPVQTSELCAVDYCENQASWMVQLEGAGYENPLCDDHVTIIELGDSVTFSTPRN